MVTATALYNLLLPVRTKEVIHTETTKLSKNKSKKYSKKKEVNIYRFTDV